MPANQQNDHSSREPFSMQQQQEKIDELTVKFNVTEQQIMEFLHTIGHDLEKIEEYLLQYPRLVPPY